MKIGEMAGLVGVSTPTIRFYESIGLMPKPQRESGWRQYTAADLERLRVIHSARGVGFSIEEIRVLLDGFPKSTSPSQRWNKMAQNKLSELDKIIENTKALKYLIESGVDCTCKDIALCLNSEGKACRPNPNAGLTQQTAGS
ncbi:MAG TPA: MerR family transcriptional regulator [Candidatus Saccharimonadales bacterium]